MTKATTLCLAGLAICLAGCVERELTITSEPSGALVYVSGVEKGLTPLTMPFTWYGDYDVVLRLDGYQTLKTHANLRAPIYEIPPLDFLSEVAPWTYRDRRCAHFRLEQTSVPSDEQLIRQAQDLRQELQSGE